MGINVAPEIFQRKMEELLKDLPGVICYMEDILVFGRTGEEHDENLKKVLKIIQARGLKLNKEKCVFGQSQIPFLGHVIGAEGIHIDEGKVKAILSLPSPKKCQGSETIARYGQLSHQVSSSSTNHYTTFKSDVV